MLLCVVWYHCHRKSYALGFCKGAGRAILQQSVAGKLRHAWSTFSCSLRPQIHERSHLPLVSIFITVVINSLLALINIGSEAAFVAFTSLTVAAFYASYFIAASVMLYKRLTEDTTKLRWGPFRLGYLGIPISIFSLCYTAVAFVWQMFPQATPTDPEDMNYASLMFGATLLFAMGYWFIYARRVYTGPVIEIDPEEIYLNNSETKDA